MRHVPRLYLDHTFSQGQEIRPDPDHSHYLLRVMRLSDGAKIRVFNGHQGEWMCRLGVSGKSALLQTVKQLRAQVPVPDLTLFFAPVKKARTDFIIEKATELGVARIQAVRTEFTQTARLREDRLRLLAIEAAEQTERLDIPDILPMLPLHKALEGWGHKGPVFYCDEASPQATSWQVSEQYKGRPSALLIGPEGGFSANERNMIRRLQTVVPVTLGPRILRAETAVISALTLWQSKLGDWSSPPYLAPEQTI